LAGTIRAPMTIFLSPPDVGATERELLLATFDSNWIAPVRGRTRPPSSASSLLQEASPTPGSFRVVRLSYFFASRRRRGRGRHSVGAHVHIPGHHLWGQRY